VDVQVDRSCAHTCHPRKRARRQGRAGAHDSPTFGED
jgi:hypothetical protein